MAKTAISADTPVEGVLDDRPALIRLAQVVFERTTAQYLRAFSRFRKSSDLAALIQSHREGVFDYGVCIIDSDTGPKMPKVEDVLAALKLAIDGEITAEDMEALGLSEEYFGKVCPALTEDKPKTRKPRTRKPAAKKDEPKAEEPKTAPKPRTVRKPKEDAKVVQMPGTERGAPADLSPLLERLDQLSSDIGAALSGADEKFESKVDALQAEISSLRTGLFGVVNLFDVINGRLDIVGKYFVDEFIEWPEVPEEVTEALASLVDASEDKPAAKPKTRKPRAAKPKADAPKAEEKDEELPPEVDGGEVDAGADDAGEVEYTREDLDAKELDELRDIAASLGIPRAAKIGYKAVAIKKILKAAAA